VLAEIERRDLLAQVQAAATCCVRLLEELVARHPQLLAGQRGWGLLQGLVLRPEAPSAPQVVKAALAEGLLLVPAGATVVRFVPPLTIKPKHLREAVQLLERALLSLV
jgi:acetylornithine/N-succinyldiaminopimelate aminotransferase